VRTAAERFRGLQKASARPHHNRTRRKIRPNRTSDELMNSIQDIEWDEELPPGCPPDDAWEPNGSIFFRMVESVPPNDRDFWSHRRLWPNKQFSVSECRARSVSLFERIDDCAKLLKLPLHRDKSVVKLRLSSGSGLVKQTGGYSHHSWWRARGFQVVDHCELLDAA
jgi:hypothetical protein